MDPLRYSEDRFSFRIWGHPISKRRLVTSVRTAIAICVGSTPLIFAFPFMNSGIALICLILTGTTASLSHFMGSTSTSAGHQIAAGMLGSIVGFPLSFITIYTSRWLGVALLFVFSFIIAALFSIWDPAYRRMNVLKFGMLDLTILLVFPVASTAHTPYWHASLQLLLAHFIMYLVPVLLGVFQRPLPPQIAVEASHVIYNCGVSIKDVINHLRFSKPTAPRTESIGDNLVDVDIPDDHPRRDEETRVLLEQSEFDRMQESQAALRQAEKVIIRQLESIRLMINECNNESWVGDEMIACLKALYKALDTTVQLLVTIRLAVEDGFVKRLTSKILRPMRSRLDELDLLLSKTIMICHTSAESCFDESAPVETEPATPRAKEALKVVGDKLFKAYENAIRKLEVKGSLITSPTADVTRMSFVLYCLVDLRNSIEEIDGSIQRLRETAMANTKWHFFWSWLFMAITPFFDFIKHGAWFLKSTLSLFTSRVKVQRMGVRESLKEWVQNRAWRFPLRFALSLTAVAALSVFVDILSPIDIKTVWICATTIFVIGPSVGSSVRKGVHRAVGTVVGAFVAQIFRFVIAAAVASSVPAGMVVLLLLTFLFAIASTYSQHSSKYPKPYQWIVATFSFEIVAFYLFPYTDVKTEWWIGLLRAAHVLIGDSIASIGSLLVPHYSLSIVKTAYRAAVGKIHIPLESSVLGACATEESKAVVAALVQVPFITKDALKEAKSELKLQCKSSQIPFWQRCHDSFGPMASCLATMVRLTTNRTGFLESIPSDIVRSTVPYMTRIVELIKKDVDQLDIKLKGDPQPEEFHSSAMAIQSILQDIEAIHLEGRNTAVQNKELHVHSRKLLRFNALIFSVQLFSRHWSRFSNALLEEL